MSEEEIIRNVKRIIEYKVISNYINDNDSRAIQGLLDLYQKEKEKNKILEDLLQGNLYEMYKYYKNLCNSYQANSISKDKIKELAKKYEYASVGYDSLTADYKQSQDIGRYIAYVELLKELLEE